MVRIINATPHNIVVSAGDGSMHNIESSPDHLVRLCEMDGQEWQVNDFTIVERRYGTAEVVSQLKAFQSPSLIIVALPVQLAIVQTELDRLWETGVMVVSPDTGPKGGIRDDAGRIIGTRRFIRVIKQ